MKEDGPGIDYSMGMANIDKESGIHYGVIHQNEVAQAWADESEADYGMPIETECQVCGLEFQLDNSKFLEWGDMAICPDCGEETEITLSDSAEAIAFIYEEEGYKCSQSANDSDIFVLKSPYYTLCAFCSPCAPGAGYIMDSRPKGGIRAYCFGHEWFEGGKAPYMVYDVVTEAPVPGGNET